MKEEVIITHVYKAGHRVDKQLLLSLDDIFKMYNKDRKLKLEVECDKGVSCTFDSIDECFEYFEKKPYKIIEMVIEARLSERSHDKRIIIRFNNRIIQSTTVAFSFDNNDDYLLLKNKIELCLENFKLNYRVLAIVPIIPVMLTLFFIVICIYTNINGIVYPLLVQKIIISIWLGGSVLLMVLPSFVRIKRAIFPFTEFRIGQNEMREERKAKIRGYLIGTVLIGLTLSIIVNATVDYLF